MNADVPERSIDPVTNFSLYLHVYFSYAPVMFSNQTDPTGKLMNLVIAHCVIAQMRYMVSWHMVFEVVACLLSRVYIYIGVIWKQLGIL